MSDIKARPLGGEIAGNNLFNKTCIWKYSFLTSIKKNKYIWEK